MTLHDSVNKVFRRIDGILYRTFGTVGGNDGSQRVHLHWQNLNDNNPGEEVGPPFEGRCWLNFYNGKRGRSIRFAWNLWTPSWLLSSNVHVHPGQEDELALHLNVWPMSFWLAFEGFAPRKLSDWWQEHYQYDARECRFSLHIDPDRIFKGLVFSYDFWRNPHEWSSDEPRWRRLHVDLMDKIFGDIKAMDVVRVKDKPVKIPMPEGLYDATLTLKHTRFKRPRLPFIKFMALSNIDCPVGIPHEGKGENSWDCGEDALFGMSAPAKSEGEAIMQFMSSVLKERLKYNSGGLQAKYASPEERAKRQAEAREKYAAERAAAVAKHGFDPDAAVCVSPGG